MKITLILLLVLACGGALAAPKAKLLPGMNQHDPNSRVKVPHKTWDDFLRQYLTYQDGVAVVDYTAAVSEADALQDYLDYLAQVPVHSLNRTEQLVFWFNLYNALTVKVVLDNYPVSSIKDISSGLFSSGPWQDKLIVVAAKQLSLNDIEHRILRPIWQDMRIHYAVNCASISCPNLMMQAFSADQVEQMLEDAATAYINHPRGVTVKNGRLEVSSIYNWYAVDFGTSDAAIIAHFKQYANPELRAQLQGITSLADDHYNWSLNDSKQP